VTFNTTAAEIAAEWAEEGTDARNLELEILRHMEHHILRAANTAYENAARIVEGDPELGTKRFQIATYIRGKIHTDA
jgi:hypothetical protein